MRISGWSSDVCSSDLFRPMQALKALVIFMAVLIVAGMVLLVYGLVSRTGGGGSMGGGEPIGGGEGDVASLDLPVPDGCTIAGAELARSEEHTSELQPLMRTSYAVFCLKKKNQN